MNDVKLFGNIAQAPEHGETKNGTAFCNFAIGCREIDKKKKFNDKSTFVDCVVYGLSAEFMKKAGQGDEILVAKGSIQVQSWKNQEGKWQKKFRVLVDKFIIPKVHDAANSMHMEDDIPRFEDVEVEGDANPFN